MAKLRVTTREIGSVCVFDIEGEPTLETVQEVAEKIQRNIRRHRLQRVILNLQYVASLDSLGIRKLLAACIRPQRSLIYGASSDLIQSFEDTYMPRNVRICSSEKEVAEDFGPFLLEKDKEKEYLLETRDEPAIGTDVERRRSKRMHVAIPVELKLYFKDGSTLATRAIATNISEGGMFTEYLDLEVANRLSALEGMQGQPVDIHIYPSANFPEEYNVRGTVTRKELRKKQLGLGLEFKLEGESKL